MLKCNKYNWYSSKISNSVIKYLQFHFFNVAEDTVKCWDKF